MSVDESTRVIVKNIPKHCDEKRLRAHFESISPDVTDVRVMKTKEGKSRCFGFIGFRSAEAASHCRAVSDRSYIDTSRISVEMARRYGDEDLARPWSRYSKGSSAYNKANPDEAADAGEPASRKGSDGGATSKVGKAAGNKADPLAARVHSDPKLAEFLQLMAPKSKQKQLWNNDLAAGPAEPSRQRTTPAGGKSATGAAAECEGEEDGEGEEDDDSEYEELPAALSGKETDAGDGGEDDEDEEEEATEGADGGGQREMSDLDYLKSKKRKWLEDDEEDEKDEEAREEEVAEENDEDVELEEELDEELDGIDADEEAEEAEEMDDGATAAVHGRGGAGAASTADAAASGDAAELAEHGRLFARNLPFSVSEDELREAFETFGEVAEIHVPMDTHTRRGKGFAYVRYATGEHAVAALAELDGSIFQGRILHLLPSRESAHEKKLRAADGAGDDKGSNYKDQKAASLKAKAQEGTNWNSLFMRPDAVGDAMAKRYGVAKSDFLDPSADSSMAVKLAQGETHLIAQSTAWLAEHGVSLEALQQAVQAGSGGGATGGATQRSKTLILVKNLSADVTEDEIATLFAKHGQVCPPCHLCSATALQPLEDPPTNSRCHLTEKRLRRSPILARQLGSVLLTPSNTLALVEFLEVGEARRAFRSVAYTKVHGVPIYLEWAPVGVLEKNRADATAANGSSSGADGVAAAAEAGRTGLAAAKEKSGAAATGVAKAAVGQAAAAVAVGGDDVDADDTEGRTLFVKNLSFQSSQDDLLTLFSKR